eukprot:12792403-Alexandrium_andersonii.AAC.1
MADESSTLPDSLVSLAGFSQPRGERALHPVDEQELFKASFPTDLVSNSSPSMAGEIPVENLLDSPVPELPREGLLDDD